MHRCPLCTYPYEYKFVGSLYKHFRDKHDISFSVRRDKFQRSLLKARIDELVHGPLTLKQTIRLLQEKYMSGDITKEQYMEMRKKTMV